MKEKKKSIEKLTFKKEIVINLEQMTTIIGGNQGDTNNTSISVEIQH